MSRLPDLGPRGEGWLAGQVVLFVAITAAAVFAGTSVAEPAQTVVRVVGAALIAIGLLLIGLGSWQLSSALSPMPRPIASGTLVERGVYRFVRHPIYAGVLLASFGAAVYTVSVIAALLAIVLAVWLDLKARREEAWLAERYPGYADYARRTRRFIPAIY